jgi:hypothetical protein
MIFKERPHFQNVAIQFIVFPSNDPDPVTAGLRGHRGRLSVSRVWNHLVTLGAQLR